VIPHLISNGHHVTGIDNFARYGRIDRSRDYEFYEADLTIPDIAHDLLGGVDGVIQAAATIYGVGGFHKRPATILANDLSLHANILHAATKAGVKRVTYISSSMVYERVDSTPSSEENADRYGIPVTDYGLSKLVGERMSRAFWTEFGLEFTIWRPFNIITPSEHAEDEIGISHVFADYIEALVVRRENPLKILGDGEQIRCFTWIDDVARAIADFSFAVYSRNETFNLGNPSAVTMKELAQRIFAKAQMRGLFPPNETLAFQSLPAYAGDVRRRVPDVRKVATVLGWKSTIELDEALDICIDRALIAATAGT